MKQKYNLLVVNQFASHPRNLYGPGERMFHMAKYLKDEFAITVVAGAYSHLFKVLPETKSVFNVEQEADLKYVWIRLLKYNGKNFVGRIWSWFEFVFRLFFMPLRERPDVVLVSSMSLLPIIYAIKLKKKFKIPFVLEIRDIWPLTATDIGGYSKFNPLIILLKKIELLGYKHADHLVSVLPGFGLYLRQSGINKDFTWIPNGVPFSQAISEEVIRENVKSNKIGFSVLYAGTFGKANALEHFIDAANLLKEHNNIKFVLIGDGPSEKDLKLRAAGNPNIHFMPKVPKAKIGAFIEEADVCYIGWHDRKIYSFGVSANKYNDYMLAKKPILSCSNIVEDPVKLSNSGLQVSPDDPKYIVDGIMKFYNMTNDERASLGLNGYNFVVANQTYHVLARRYRDVLINLV